MGLCWSCHEHPSKPHRWTREQYERVVRLGGFEPGQRLESIDGQIVDAAPQNEPHAVALCLLDEALRRAYGDGIWGTGWAA